MSTLNEIFLWCLSSSIMASVVALIVVLAKIILKNRINARVYCVLWLLVLIRLILPFAPESPISIFNLLIDEGQKEAMHQYNISIVSTISLVWLSGTSILIFIVIYSHMVFLRKSKNFLQINDPETLSILKSCKSNLGINTSISLYLAPGIKSPCIAGVIRPRIFIPENTYELVNHQQLRHILMHELAHYKRKDVLLNHLITAVNIFYWFNPVIWYAFIQMNRDREIACDTCVLEALEQDESIPYAMTLIKMTRFLSQNQRPMNLASFCKNEKQIEKRIDRIKLFRKGTYRISAVALVCCVMVGAMSLTNATSSKEKAFTKTGGNAGAYNSVEKNKENYPRITNKLHESLDSWLRTDVILRVENLKMKSQAMDQTKCNQVIYTIYGTLLIVVVILSFLTKPPKTVSLAPEHQGNG